MITLGKLTQLPGGVRALEHALLGVRVSKNGIQWY
jgi:hypothetical protein